MMRLVLSAFLVLAGIPVLLADEKPVVLDKRLVLELVAEQPQIVTPTGIAVDTTGRILVLENHTHHRPSDYIGPTSDRIRVFEDFDERGRARKVTTWADGFKDAMGLTIGPDRTAYVATRAAIYCLKDSGRQIIVRLETKGDYPHNGLCGFAWDHNGDLIFGLGENLGASYRLVGGDGRIYSGGGEGGSIYRCRPDGSPLSRIATGFWNPFGLTINADGHLFAVDNDPDSRGPCRLLHIVQGGDYGYRFRYGRKGTYPFQSWNGELPGTLPMVAGTSEAPSGIVPGEFTALPQDYRGSLLVTSWGDHTIERFPLQPLGASFSAQPKVIVRGGENFRPVAFAVAPDGSIVFSDWVDKSYPVHGKGRIWRLRALPEFRGTPVKGKIPAETKSEEAWAKIAFSSARPAERREAVLHLHAPHYLKRLVPLLADPDPFLVAAALEVLGRSGQSSLLLPALDSKGPPSHKLGMLLALRRTDDAGARSAVGRFLADPDPGVRRAAIQWVAEERLTEHADKLQSTASTPPVTRELFEAWLAARELLEGKKSNDPNREVPGEQYIAAILRDTAQPLLFRALALRLLRPDHPLLTPELLTKLALQPTEPIRGEAIRSLSLRSDPGAQAALRRLAIETQPDALRALGVMGLALSASERETQQVLEQTRKIESLRAESERSLGKRPAILSKRNADEWRKLLSDKNGDAVAGERIFFGSRGPGCYKCHRIDARGAAIGPDLTFVARSTSRDKLIDSILEPSKELAPAFTSWRIMTRDGKERVGMIVSETFDSFVQLADNQGKVERILRTDIEERIAVPKSIMPDDLANQLDEKDFLDLLAFLMERK